MSLSGFDDDDEEIEEANGNHFACDFSRRSTSSSVKAAGQWRTEIGGVCKDFILTLAFPVILSLVPARSARIYESRSSVIDLRNLRNNYYTHTR
ncbi:hypothetical protein BT96DRAFT_1020048 [Gymnopus androsaceus JB14]|uniref:Uncharacterized protein n=1 Tax=Gymnopus androsaceus JB14 TaxID=1447944 RepID=A0A6A4HKW3_9AGAR|nr:hypothetical protein BT96DRAFT_1020048 [Gymnopus androsaceus JB14]